MTSESFLEAVKRIAKTNPDYRTGGIGEDGTCDCIGLIMGAMYELGRKDYPIHSSNFFARKQTEDLSKIIGTILTPGMIVYKAREDKGTLNDRYKPGGVYHTGDLLDYYHVGVVESVEPMRIVHCTSSATVDGIAYDNTTRGWTHAGFVKGLEYLKENQGAEGAVGKAVVHAEFGKTVNLRQRPSVNGEIVARIQLGTVVNVHESARNDLDEVWCKITADKNAGYMMAKYLKTYETEKDQLTVRIPRTVAVDLLTALQNALKG